MRLPTAAACAVGFLAATLQAQEPDFKVDFGGPAQPIPPGLWSGMNELSNSAPGVWRAWTESVGTRGGLIRLWLKYHEANLGQMHLRTCATARENGFGILITISGEPGARVDLRDGGELVAPDVERFVRQAEQDLQRLLAADAPVQYVEIWNEPDMPHQWVGTPESFARFFATVGQRLRKSLPPEVKVGGPGMAAFSGQGMARMKLILDACRDVGWQPDFLSWHDYSGLPMDQHYYDPARRLEDYARRLGLQPPEMIMSEWNCGLPGRDGSFPALDDHRAAATFVSMTTALAQTSVTHSLFFYLQDGFWDTKKDFDGNGAVGVFTINGAPKSVLAGMRMTAQACALPRVPVQPRADLPVCFSLLATREGQRGFLLAASVTSGKTDQHAKRLVERAGVDLQDVAGMEAVIKRFARGDLSYEKTGLPEKDREVWERAAAAMRTLAKEHQQKARGLTAELRDPPRRITRAWVIDATHANPIADEDFRRKFQPFERGGPAAAMELTLQQLRGEGVAESELSLIESAFRSKDEAALARLPRATATRARAVYASMTERIENEVPRELARHPAAAPAEVAVSSWAQLQGNRLTLQLPPYTSLLLEVSWDPDPADER